MKFIFEIHKEKQNPKKILFLDRDGVIIKDTGYPYEQDKVIFELRNILKIKNLFEDSNFDCCGFVTNQSGVGRKIFSETDFWNLHNIVLKKCNNLGLKINFTSVNFFQHREYYRKPNNGMLEQAMEFFECHFEQCLFIGDKITDENAAKKSKIRFKYIQELVES